MIILPNQGLGFIAITKCASTTVEASLKGHKAVTISGTAELKHVPFRDVERFVLPLLAARKVARPHFFAIVRHPVARVLSWYHFRSRRSLETAKAEISAHRFVGNMSLHEFVDQAISGDPLAKGYDVTQSSFVTDASCRVAVDTLIKIEHLDAVLPAFLRHFNIKPEASIARLNVTASAVAEEMPADLARKIERSQYFAADMELYRQAVDSLPDKLPLRKKKVTPVQPSLAAGQSGPRRRGQRGRKLDSKEA